MLDKLARIALADSLVLAGLAAGTSLPDIRRAFASEAGEDASLVLGFVDPRYYRALGLANPLPAPPSSTPYAKADGTPSVALARAIRRRRDESRGTSLARWDTLAASVEATTGDRPSAGALKALYARGGGDLATSYAGRGTREGAKATREDAAAEVRAAGGK